MYGILFRTKDKIIYPLTHQDTSMRIYDTTRDAEEMAAFMHEKTGDDFRVISLAVTEDCEFDDNGTRIDCEYKSGCIRDCYSCDNYEEDLDL